MLSRQASNARFHPLKAGRRPSEAMRMQLEALSFHPLKAGRRPAHRAGAGNGVRVSIPSRRVGDREGRKWQKAVQAFPSPQGGSETFRKVSVEKGTN